MIVNEVNNNLLYKVINNTRKDEVFESAQKRPKMAKNGPFLGPSGGGQNGQKSRKNHDFYVQ